LTGFPLLRLKHAAAELKRSAQKSTTLK
jgi:hypothetical protein